MGVVQDLYKVLHELQIPFFEENKKVLSVIIHALWRFGNWYGRPGDLCSNWETPR